MHRVVDSGLPPSAPPHADAFPWPAQRELAVVLYTPNVLRGSPHALTVLVRDDGEPMEPCAEGGMGALERYRQIAAGLSARGETGAAGMEGVAVLRNSLPG